MNSKIMKALDGQSDERTVYENGKIYKNVLQIIVFITNIIYFFKLYSVGVYGDILFNIIMFVINFCTFIGILKTLKIGTFEGSIHKMTFYWSTFYIINLLNLVIGVLNVIFKFDSFKFSIAFLIGVLIALIIDIVQITYITNKVKKNKLINE